MPGTVLKAERAVSRPILPPAGSVPRSSWKILGGGNCHGWGSVTPDRASMKSFQEVSSALDRALVAEVLRHSSGCVCLP